MHAPYLLLWTNVTFNDLAILAISRPIETVCKWIIIIIVSFGIFRVGIANKGSLLPRPWTHDSKTAAFTQALLCVMVYVRLVR